MLLVSQVPIVVHGVNVAYLHNVFVMKFYVSSVLNISTVKHLLYDCKYTVVRHLCELLQYSQHSE